MALNNVHDYAKYYVDLGLTVLPTKPGGKEGVLSEEKTGSKWGATNDPKRLKEIFKEENNYNIAIKTGGEIKGGYLTVLDIDRKDGKDGFNFLENEAKNIKIPSTLTVMTPNGGCHLYYITKKKFNKLETVMGLDIRGDKSYIMAPPSRVNGNVYKYEGFELSEDENLLDHITIGGDEIIQFIFDFHENLKKSKTVNKNSNIPVEKGDIIEDLNSTIHRERDHLIYQGERNDKVFRYACRYQALGYPDEDIIDAINYLNDNYCSPPLEQKELDGILKSALSRYEKGNYKQPFSNIKQVTECFKAMLPDEKELLEENKYSFSDFLDMNIPDDFKYKFYITGAKGQIKGYNDYLLAQFLVNTLSIVKLSEQLHIYDKGYYKPDRDNSKIYKLINKMLLDEHNKLIYKKNTYEQIYSFLTESEEINDYIPPFNEIYFKNGIYDFLSGEFRNHSYKNKSIIQIDMSIDPMKIAEAGNFDKISNFYKFASSSIGDLDTFDLFVNYLAYTLTTSNKGKKSLVLVGPSDTGKSVMLNFYGSLFDDRIKSTFDLSELNGRFTSAELTDKLINICSDITSTPLEDSAKFKSITGGDTISAEIKNGPTFVFKPFVRFIFSANRLPTLKGEEDLAFWNRLFIIPFERGETIPNLEKALKKEQKNVIYHLLYRLTQGNIFASDGTIKLKDTSTTQEERKKLLNRSNPLRALLNDYFIHQKGERVEASKVYDIYKSCSSDYGLNRSMGNRTFYKSLEDIGYRIIRGTANKKYIEDLIIDPDSEIFL